MSQRTWVEKTSRKRGNTVANTAIAPHTNRPPAWAPRGETPAHRTIVDPRNGAIVSAFYDRWRFREASFDDLGRAVGSAAGEEVLPWLAQWLDRPGAPALRLLHFASRPRGGAHVLELTLAQTQGGAPYLVDVPVHVTLADRPDAVLHTLHLAAARQRFTVDLPAEPVRVDVDPEYDVFRRLDPAELPPTLGAAFGATEAVAVLRAGDAPVARGKLAERAPLAPPPASAQRGP